MAYNGRNSNRIIAIVAASVEFYNAGSLLASIYKAIREDKSITSQERDIVIKIFTAYAGGRPATSLGVAGGLSQSSIDETSTQIERAQSQASQPSTLTQQIVGPTLRPVQLSASSRQQITRYIKANLRPTSLENETVANSVSIAQNILNLRTNAQKQNEFRRLKNAAQNANSSQARIRYNAVTQVSVLNEIASGWNVKNFGVNAIQVPEPFRI
jgi:hypothetical protein